MTVSVSFCNLQLFRFLCVPFPTRRCSVGCAVVVDLHLGRYGLVFAVLSIHAFQWVYKLSGTHHTTMIMYLYFIWLSVGDPIDVCADATT